MRVSSLIESIIILIKGFFYIIIWMVVRLFLFLVNLESYIACSDLLLSLQLLLINPFFLISSIDSSSNQLSDQALPIIIFLGCSLCVTVHSSYWYTFIIS